MEHFVLRMEYIVSCTITTDLDWRSEPIQDILIPGRELYIQVTMIEVSHTVYAFGYCRGAGRRGE